MLKKTPKIYPDPFLDQLKEIEKEATEAPQQLYEQIDLRDLNTPPPTIPDLKKLIYKEQYRRKKEW